ncbi:MAG: hypothetical protein ACYCXY_11790, partial [Acidimicrobiales bacterium]
MHEPASAILEDLSESFVTSSSTATPGPALAKTHAPVGKVSARSANLGAQLRLAVATWPRLLRHPSRAGSFARALLLFAAAEVAVRTARLPSAARWFGAELEFSDTPPVRAGGTLALSPSERRRLSVLTRVAHHWPLGPRGACLRLSLAA